MTFLSRRIATSAAAATLLAALSVPTLAQTPPPGPQARSEQMQEMRKERMENWAAKFKQQLQLTPAQEGAWSTYMEAMKPREHARLGTDWKDLRALPTPERIDRLRALREQHAADADRRGEATKAFYGQLTPAQQKTLDTQSLRWMEGMRGKGMHHPDHQGGPRHGGPGHRMAPPPQQQ
ncbi:LTXXQ motif family protein [Paenacidovorax caeni]|uniref:LTXXQ motif family protein n=1 Tax=Paenacidovorax caeni TaxID=343013 RepID=A0A1I7I9Q4_9BURK|nr:Spy/CpxP family protein refolding chaperone [Paenacidovorax caeni]SFU69580.1 LTXXQ motif family protein [Paenacidovorax caeni]